MIVSSRIRVRVMLTAGFVGSLAGLSLLGDTDISFATERQTTNVTSTVSNGLRVVNVDTPNGKLIVKLPDDIRTGDTISGTMVEQPKGDTPTDREKNRAAIRSRVIRLLLNRASTKSGDPAPTPVVVSIPVAGTQTLEVQTSPRFGDSTAFQMKVLAPGQLSLGKELDRGLTDTVTVPIDERSDKTKGKVGYDIPPLGQTGRPMEIRGPSDGNSSNTKVNLTPIKGEEPPKPEDDPELAIIAESPRKIVVAVPDELIGRSRIDVNDNGTLTSGPFRLVGVSLSAPKTNLLKGEKVEMTVMVSGLDYLREPVPMTLQAVGVITMSGGNSQSFEIKPSQVGADGQYRLTRTITGLQAGGWTATATVVIKR